MTEKLFQIEFLHSYFSDGRLRNCRLLPDADTARIMDRYQLLPRMQDGVFSLHTLSQPSAAELLAYLQGLAPTEPLRFFLVCDEADFFAMTELPLDWVGQLDLRSQSVRKDPSGKSEMLARYGAAAGADGGVAVISIYPADLLSADAGAGNYLVTFHAKRAPWLYYLVNRSELKLENPVVVGRNGDVFDGPYAIVLPGGENALRFDSGNEQFPLQQTPTLMFDLIDRPSGAQQPDGFTMERCLIKGLPVAARDKLSVVLLSGQSSVVFAMHVYL